MSDEAFMALSAIFGIVMGLLVIFLISQMPNSTELNAIKAGAARWVADENGRPKIEWVVPKPTNNPEKTNE